ncbi:MAG: SDR family oxidoreductase [Leptolyngbya sp. PLA2]|nr:SDR family NAD(P)-dependent oxidoreductase [Leptolyngbya sp.]MCE7972499.1 SDR family oxidoreductase [Leptolyngbya sp. PL-A2]MCQ3941118.1 pteridine reductase [cyanobacterium CYA1]MCZ7633184.1 SDR family oxidoreductase [Phycisphaerales bacterium]MDL1905401.1 SDR family oxidoreductase [Synechococcales cyanobacterium CNB]GIK18338.1 MAG: pteridine reductase [Planctomycetota bacterium]
MPRSDSDTAGDPTSSLADRPVALVTGGVRRVGLAVAHALADAGCDLIVTWRSDADAARKAAALLHKAGASVRLERLDLEDLASVAALGEMLAVELKRLDVIVHNASVYGPTPLARITSEAISRHFRVNALSPLLLSSRLAGRLAESPRPGGGSIVAMLDIHSLGRPRRGYSAYSMSKAALAEMVQSLARELAPRVRVNGVAPGVVAWPESGAEADPEAQKAYLKRVPLARAGTPQDAAEAVRWLALDAHYVTGEIVRVDGGRWVA